MRVKTHIKRFNGYIKSLKLLRKTRLQVEKIVSTNEPQHLVVSDKSSGSISCIERYRGQRALFAENFHLNNRNFGSLYEFCNSRGIAAETGIEKNSPSWNMMLEQDKYNLFEKEISFYRAHIEKLSDDDLVNYEYRSIRLMNVVLDEYLASNIWKFDERITLEKALRREIVYDVLKGKGRENFVNLIAAAMYWVDYWSKLDNLYRYHYVFVFSGAPIYARVLLELLKTTSVRCFVCESFFTGSSYYLEERNNPIPNNSRIMHSNFFKRHIGELTLGGNLDWSIISSNEVFSGKGKNTLQVDDFDVPEDFEGEKIFTILCQVSNDYSLISGCGSVLDSVESYKKLITNILKYPDVKIVVKCHPWESNKIPSKEFFTYEKLSFWISTLSEDEIRRVCLIDHCSMSKLLDFSSAIFTICSQAAFEAALQGLKPYTIGGAFYDSLGFTNAFENEEDAVQHAMSFPEACELSFAEYCQFRQTLAELLRWHFIPERWGSNAAELIHERLVSFEPVKSIKPYVNELG